MAVNSDKAEMA